MAQLPNASARTRRLAALRKEIASGVIAAPVIPHFETYINFLLLTAARRSEALALKWADVDFEDRSAFLHDSKNGRSRTLGLRQPLIEMLKRLPRSGERSFHSHSMKCAGRRNESGNVLSWMTPHARFETFCFDEYV